MKKSRLRSLLLRMVETPEGATPTGGSGPTGSTSEPSNEQPKPAPRPAKSDDVLGEGGIKALQAERERAKSEAQQRKDLETRLADMEKKIAETEQQAAASAKESAEKALLVTKHEVATAKGVPAGLLVGNTRDELEAYADGLIEFQSGNPPTPAPDPSASSGGEPPAPKDLKSAIDAHYKVSR